MKPTPCLVAIPLFLSGILAADLLPQVVEVGDCPASPDALVSGGVPKDGIPALTDPATLRSAEQRFLIDSDMVLGVAIGAEARAYPHLILWWHEIINDRLGGQPIVVSYCPLTGTGIHFSGLRDGQRFTFGVSGLLFDNNLVMYDRVTDSLWPQMCGVSISGSEQGQMLETVPMVECTWGVWKRLYPETDVVSTNTGYGRSYGTYPYGSYRDNDEFILFPIQTDDPRLPRKTMVFGLKVGVIERAYPWPAMGEEVVLNDELNGRKVVVAWDRDGLIALAFDRIVDGEELTFFADSNPADPLLSSLVHLRDRETGTLWNLRGEPVEGPLAGTGIRLQQIPAYNAFWFAWATFWPNTEIADIGALTTVEEAEDEIVPESFRLAQNFPNPFNPQTRIAFELPRTSWVRLTVYTLNGRVVRRWDLGTLSTGRHTLTWDGLDEAGQEQPSGVYLYELRADGVRETRKMTLLR